MHKLNNILVGLLAKVLIIAAINIEESMCLKSIAPIVQTGYGKVEGRILTSRDKRPFYSFKKIPFAKPPVKSLRFKAPVAPESWKGVLDGKDDGPICIQKNYLFDEHPKVEGQEDCLYLNVYTPKLPNKIQSTNALLPVMVFIHYSGFFAGTGNSNYIGPEYFMDKDVLLITFNYRLGVFGFLSTNDDASPGNWGLKDQVAALKWVRNNIRNFGGDCKKITIFGDSAGAGSVHYHLLSSTTKNLFQKAISQSGSTLSLWARPFNTLQAQIAMLQAKFVNCTETDTQAMVNCLRKVDAVTLAESADKFKFFSSEPFILYAPVTETKSDLNSEPYITEDPLSLLLAGKFHKVPWIVGVVADEGILRASTFLRNPKTRDQLIVLAMARSVSLKDIQNTWSEITNYYLGGNSINITNPQSVQGFINLYSDRAITYGSYQSALLHAWKGHESVWFYKFDYRGEYSYGDHYAGTTEDIDFNWGVCHTDDLLYLFSSPQLFKPLKSNSDIIMSKALLQMWTDFAINGDPSPNNQAAKLKWKPLENLQHRDSVKNTDLVYLNIAGISSDEETPITFEIRNDFLTDRMMFWESLPLAENIKGIGFM